MKGVEVKESGPLAGPNGILRITEGLRLILSFVHKLLLRDSR